MPRTLSDAAATMSAFLLAILAPSSTAFKYCDGLVPEAHGNVLTRY